MLLLTNSLRPDLETNGRIKRDLSRCGEQSDDGVCTSDIQIFCGLSLSFKGSDPISHQITIASYVITSHTSISHGCWAWVSMSLVVSVLLRCWQTNYANLRWNYRNECNCPASYSGRPGFKSRHENDYPENFVIFPQSPQADVKIVPQIFHDHIFCPRFSIRYSLIILILDAVNLSSWFHR
jgi:hypothetical protein